MKAIYSLMLSASVLSLISANAEEKEPEEAFPSTFSLFSTEKDLLVVESEPLKVNLANSPAADAIVIEEGLALDEEFIDEIDESFAEADLEVQENDLAEIAALLEEDAAGPVLLESASEEIALAEENLEQPEVDALLDERFEVALVVPEETAVAEEIVAEDSIEEEIAEAEPVLPSAPSIEEDSFVGIAASTATPEEIIDEAIESNSFEETLSFASEDRPVESLEKAQETLPLAVFDETSEAANTDIAAEFSDLKKEVQGQTDAVIEKSKELSAIPYNLDKDAQQFLTQHNDSAVEKVQETQPAATPKSEKAVAVAAPQPKTIQEGDLISEEEMAAFDAADKGLIASGDTTYSETASITENYSLKEDAVFTVDLQKAFSGSPLIYSFLLILSMGTVGVWLYNLAGMQTVSKTPENIVKDLRSKLIGNQYEEATSLCLQHNSLFCRMMLSGISSRKFGPQVMVESMKSEGKRATVAFWQRISLLNDVAIIAPMLGLLGTVLGMFYAFYDINRSTESVATLFDGLGVSVGTTVAGLVVAILALVLQSVSKYRLVKVLARVENEANSLAAMIDSKVAIFQDK